MPYAISWENNGVGLHFYGKVAPDDIAQAYGEVNNDSRYCALKYEIVDFSAITHIAQGIKEEEMYAHMEQTSSLINPRLKMAVVVSGQETPALASYYVDQMRDSKRSLEAFTTVEIARGWISG